MKSPTLLQTSDALNFNLLQRNSANADLRVTYTKKTSRRTSRKNLLIFALVYGALLVFLISFVL
jgi:hypothetical protein